MANTERKFYCTTIQVRVLSEQPLEWETLGDIDFAINEDCVGDVRELRRDVIDVDTTAALLVEFGSEPGFFELNGLDDEEVNRG